MRPCRLLLLFVSLVALTTGLLAGELLPPAAVTAEPSGAGPALVTLVALGDTIVHEPELAAAWDATACAYDFRPMFAEVKPLLERADLAVAVLETTLGGPESSYTGYPRFNSPDGIAEALAWAGVDVVFTAHNHMLDRGKAGLLRTLDCLDRLGLAHVGSARTPEPAARFVLKEVNGVKFAFLSYTTMTNGIPIPASCPWAVNLYREWEMAADVARARAAGADIVAAAVHYGIEYQRRPDAAQRAIVDQMIRAGVDVVLGSHPHVIQPVEMRSVPGADGIARTAFVAYSLGNLLSNQRWRYSDCGLMAGLTVAREPGRPAGVAASNWRPLWVHRYQEGGRPRYRILPADAGAATAYADDPYLTAADRRRLVQVWEETAALMEAGP